MATSHAFSLAFGRPTCATIDVYDRYAVAIDMLKAGNEWSFALWNSQLREGAWAELKRAVKFGDQIVFSIDGAPQMNGPVETGNLTVNRGGGAQLVISGRDIAATAIDWDADPRVTLRGAPFGQALSELLNRVGVTVAPISADDERAIRGRATPGSRGHHGRARTQRVSYAHAKQGERVWPLVQSLAKRLGLLVWVAPDADGGMSVVADVPNYAQAPVFRFDRVVRDGSVTLESNILESGFEINIRDVPTHVYVYARAERGDAPSARVRAYTDGTALTGANGSPATPANAARLAPVPNAVLAAYPQIANPLPPHPRFLHSRRARNPATARQEAMRCMAEGMAHWRVYTCTVQGHGQLVGGAMRLYTVNTMAHVTDPLSNLDDDMLITRVEFTGSRSEGQLTKLTLGTKGSIQVFPEDAV